MFSPVLSVSSSTCDRFDLIIMLHIIEIVRVEGSNVYGVVNIPNYNTLNSDMFCKASISEHKTTLISRLMYLHMFHTRIIADV